MADARLPRIVVAEDDPAILDLVRTRLEIAGYETFYARDGFRALEKIIAVQPAGVVLDINMPGLDGFGVLTRLKRDPRTRDIPVLVLSARNAGEDVARCVKLGAKDYLTKPFEDRMLLARVARLVRKSAPQPAQGPVGLQMPMQAPVAPTLPENDSYLI